MQRQRSFSIRPTGLLFFFAVSSSLVILLLFSVWAFSYPSPQEAHLLFSSGLLALGVRSFSPSDQSPSGISKQTHLVEAAAQGNDSAIFGDVRSSETLGSSIKASFAPPWKRKGLDLADPHLNANAAAAASYRGEDDDVSGDGNSIRGLGNDSASLVRKIHGGSCDLSSGEWVLDDSYPLYTNRSCRFIDEGFNCQANGRLDKHYMNWRWRPHGCDIPRFDASKMLAAIKGKRLVFVGDSINRNQWESMLCLLSSGLNPNSVYEARGRKITKEKGIYNFKFVDYKCSVEYYVTHFLVREGRARVGTKRKVTLRLDAMDRSSARWRGADVLVFNTAHWWSHHKTKAGVNYFQEGDQVHPHLDAAAAFRKALMTWAAWIDRNVDPGKTRVFFRTSSPSHFSGGEWNFGGHCRESTWPLGGPPAGSSGGDGGSPMNRIVGEIVKKMRTPVTLLDITGLSGLRVDGHPSIYGRRRQGGGVQDCSHWCLPGVPDTWNELLFYHLVAGQGTTASAYIGTSSAES